MRGGTVDRGDGQVGIVGQEDLVLLRNVRRPTCNGLTAISIIVRTEVTPPKAPDQLFQGHRAGFGETRGAFNVVDEHRRVEPNALVAAEGGG